MQQNNSELIKKFINELNIEGYSQKTIETYSMYLRLFEEFIKKDLKEVTSDDILNYLSYIKTEKKASSATINLILSIFKHFYNSFLKSDLDINIKLPKIPKKIPIVLTSKEISQLLDAVDNERDRLIIEFIYSTGVRVSECINMKIKNINFDEFTGNVISGKGNKDRIIIISKKWAEDYKRYLEKRNKRIDSEYLFINNVGGKLSPDTIQKFLKEYAKKANLNKNVTPHTLRHSFATSLLEHEVNIRYIQQLLGHANLNTTQIYTKVNTDQLKKIENPLDKL